MRPFFFLLFLASGLSAFAQNDKDVLFQVSTIDALLQGVYEGDITFEQVRKHGDFGIGTVDGVDGELVALNGRFLRIASDGKAYPVSDSTRTPFASITSFEPDIVIDAGPLTLEEIEAKIDAALPSPNYFYAVRITGRFESVKTRSVPRQSPPYQPLAEVVKTQPVFELRDIDGTLLGFRCPEFAKGLNVPGYHLHFLTKKEDAGGHVLGCRVRQARIEIDVTPGFEMALPATRAFEHADLVRDRSKDLQKVEK